MFDKVISTMFRANPTETVDSPVITPSAPEKPIENSRDKELCKECLEKVTLLSEENLRLTEENKNLTTENEQLTAENQTLKTVEQRFEDYRSRETLRKTLQDIPTVAPKDKEDVLLDSVRGYLEKSIRIRVKEDDSVEILDQDGKTIATDPEATRQLYDKVKAYLLAIGVLKRSYGQETPPPPVLLTPSETFAMQGLPQARAHAERLKVS